MQPETHQQTVRGTWQPGVAQRGIPPALIAARHHPQELAVMQQLVRLQQENASLRGYAERVTKELRSARLSQAVAAASAAAGGDAPVRASALAAELQHQAEALPLPPWCLNMQLVSPLLAAYDERILELQEESKEKEKVIQGFSARVAAVTRENEQLAEELRSKTARLQQIFEAEAGGALGGSGGGKTYNSLLQERNELEELYTLTSEQSEVLLSQNHLLKCHVQQSEAALEEMRVVIAETERRAAAVAAKEETLTKQEDTVAKQALQLQEAAEQKSELSKKLSSAEKEVERLSGTLAETVRQQEILQKELQRERTGAEAAAALQKEVDALKQQMEAALKETAAAKEVADYLEQRLSDQAREADEARKQAESTTQQLHAAVVEKERAVASAALLQNHLDQLRGQHEAELQILRTAQGDTLERRAVQAEELAEKLRQQLETLQRAHGEAVVKLETAERRAAAASADASQARSELASSTKHHRTVQQHQQQAQAAAEAEVARLKESLNAQNKEAASKAAALAASKRQLEDSLAAAETGRLALQQEHALLQQKCDQLQETCSAQQQQLADAAARLATTEAERDAAKRRAERETADAKRRFESLTALAEAKAARIQEAADRRQTAAAQRLMEEQQRQERMRRESEDQRQRLQQQLSKAVAANAALRQKVNELLNGLDKALLPESLIDDEAESEMSS
ncbi:non-muscle myosin II heavy chain, putative [Eimeria praecox]|uniref:Non-muscle myosin II heavy chain, putative n=1 Tax=Eimeria praecox TaxID=51316 RepID=U6H6Y3_9EIME|nr:non-muscle myosin II heavy chain, putative [Eimeria praecox]